MQAAQSPPRVLTIAGSDSGGSAGIQADLKTLTACDVFGSSALTVVTAQNTLGVQQAFPLPLALIAAQMDAVLDDIGADAIKTGLLGRAEVITLVAERLRPLPGIPLVVDPVLVNGQGQLIVSSDTIDTYREALFPLATVITPNLDEARLLSGMAAIETLEDVDQAAQRLHEISGAKTVVVKGGHLGGAQKVDVFFDGEAVVRLSAPTLPIDNPHGVGCTFAAAIAAGLARGLLPLAAVQMAHDYLHRALAAAIPWRLGQGRTPVNHFGA